MSGYVTMPRGFQSTNSDLRKLDNLQKLRISRREAKLMNNRGEIR